MCGATTGGLSVEGIDVTKEAVIQGIVTRDGEPVGGAYVRLLDSRRRVHRRGADVGDRSRSGSSPAPARWTLRTLAPGASVDRAVVAAHGAIAEVDVEL